MKNHLINGLAAAGLLLAGAALTGCGDDITNLLPDDSPLPDGSDRVSGGVFSTGTWKAAGTNADGNPFEACFNISVDGTKLTRAGSTCTENANAFSVDVDGGTDCNFYYDIDVPIVNGAFSVSNFQPDLRAPILSMQGSFNNGDASGTITVDQSAWGGGVCVARWVAYAPGNTSTDDIIADDPNTNTGAVTAGLWIDTGFNDDGEDQWSCFFVDPTGTRLVAQAGNGCNDRQNDNPGNAFNVQIERGSNDCYLYIDEQDSAISVPIVNGRMALNNYKPNEWAPALSLEGTFTSSTTASGTIKIDSPYPNGSCTAKWNVTKQ